MKLSKVTKNGWWHPFKTIGATVKGISTCYDKDDLDILVPGYLIMLYCIAHIIYFVWVNV